MGLTAKYVSKLFSQKKFMNYVCMYAITKGENIKDLDGEYWVFCEEKKWIKFSIYWAQGAYLNIQLNSIYIYTVKSEPNSTRHKTISKFEKENSPMGFRI